jgi:regulator of sigma E protease
MLAVLLFLAVLSVLVFVHELGHFLAARAFGAKVEEFGFGFPPRAYGKKIGDTVYSINWIPLGGFVRIKGENGSSGSDTDSFSYKRPWQRAIILSAGVFMNLLLAWVLLTVGLVAGLPQEVGSLPPGAVVRDAAVGVVSVLPGSPAATAGIKEGDRIVAVDGTPVTTTEAFRAYTSDHEGRPVTITTERDDSTATVSVTPVVLAETGRPGVGLGLVSTGYVAYPWYLAPGAALRATIALTGSIFATFGSILGNLFSGQPAGVELAGPVGIAFVTADVARLGLLHLLQFAAILSVNLAVLNILPIPALDGGRLLFLLIEKIRGRAANRSVEGAVHAIGFFVLIGLVLVVTYGDIMRFGDRITGAFR